MPRPDYKQYLKRILTDIREFVTGRIFTRPPELRNSDVLSTCLSDIDQRWSGSRNITGSDSSPVFIFSAGWRSGSTLLQRLLMSSKEVVIWGEPLGDAAFIPRIGYSLSTISNSWPPDNFIVTGGSVNDLSSNWIANITPEMHYLKSAQRHFFETWLGQPAAKHFNSARWGLKEVRLTIDHARYLKWLFPDAKIVFIYRNPFDAFRSWKGNRWRSVWPGYYRNSAYAFARHWTSLLTGFINGSKDIDGLVIKYEDLVSGRIDLDAIARHIGVTTVDESILEKKVGTPDGNNLRKKKPISWLDRAVIYITCRKQLKTQNYL